MTCSSECKEGEQQTDISPQSWILSCRQTSPSSSGVIWSSVSLWPGPALTWASGSDHLVMEADWLTRGARVGSEKVISEVTRCTVSTSPSSSNSLGDIGVSEIGADMRIVCGYLWKVLWYFWWRKNRREQILEMIPRIQTPVIKMPSIKYWQTRWDYEHYGNFTFTGSSFSSSWAQSSALFWYILMVRFLFYLWVIGENWAGTCLASTGHPHLSPTGFKPGERKKDVHVKV